MDKLSFIITLSPFIIGFGGLVIAGLSLYLRHKERTSLYREKIYTKQLDAYSEVFSTLSELYQITQSYIISMGGKLNDETRPQLRVYTEKEFDTFKRKGQKWSIFLPSGVNNKIYKFVKLYHAISAPKEVVQQYPERIVNSEDPGMILSDAYSEIVLVFRKGVGTEPLSQEAFNLMGFIENE